MVGVRQEHGRDLGDDRRGRRPRHLRRDRDHRVWQRGRVAFRLFRDHENRQRQRHRNVSWGRLVWRAELPPGGVSNRRDERSRPARVMATCRRYGPFTCRAISASLRTWAIAWIASRTVGRAPYRAAWAATPEVRAVKEDKVAGVKTAVGLRRLSEPTLFAQRAKRGPLLSRSAAMSQRPSGPLCNASTKRPPAPTVVGYR